jgi:hypothetical protein
MTITINGSGTGCFTDASGNAAVGTASPQFKFNSVQAVATAAPSVTAAIQVYAKGFGGSGQQYAGIGFAMNEHTNGYWGSGVLARDDTGSYGSALSFYTSTGSATPSPTEQARISSAGVLSFNSGYGSVAAAYGCRAWVNFDGTTTPPTIRASGNVSSVSRPATGYFTMNFTNSFPDTSYSTVSFCRDDGVGVMFTGTNTTYTKTTSAFTFYTTRTNGTQSNSADVSFAAFR